MDTALNYRVEELAAAAGVSVDTIRFYQGRGLLPRPRREGRVAVYDHDHLVLLERIRELADAGFTLAQISELVAGDESPDPLLVVLAEASPAATLSFDELVERSGLPEELVGAAVAAGLIRAAGTDGGFDESAVHMARAAARLLDAGVPLDALASLALRHSEQVEATVAEAVQLFRSHVKERAGGDRGELAELTTTLVPMVTQLVADHFSRTLVHHARALLADASDDGSGR